jgi:hypothetical protein
MSAYARTDNICVPLFATEEDGLNYEAYRIEADNIPFALVRISGDLNEDTVIDLTEKIMIDGLPVAVIVHTKGEGKITFTGDFAPGSSESYSVSGEKSVIQCYTDSAELSFKVEIVDRYYGEITVIYDGSMWQTAE